MSEGRLAALVARLHKRTSEVRQAAVERSQDLAEIFSGGTKGEGAAPKAPWGGQGADRSALPVEEDGSSDERRGGGFVLVRDGSEIEGPGSPSKSRERDVVPERRDPNATGTGPEIRCSSCGTLCKEEAYIGDVGVLCRDCSAVARKASQDSERGWEDKGLDALSEAVLRTLDEVHPKPLSARDIVDRLIDAGLSPQKIDKTAVNSRLYSDVSDRVERTDGTPPVWQLRQSNQESGNDDLDERALSLCPICERDVDEELSQYRGFDMCSECVKVLRKG